MRKIGKYFGLVWLLVAALVYASVLISPLQFEYASIISFAIPAIIVVSLLLLFLTAIVKSKYWYFYLIALIGAWPFYTLSFAFGNGTQVNEVTDFKVLSYNVKWFTEARKDNYEGAIDWLLAQDADFLCFQEYYPSRNISSRIRERGGYYDATDSERYNVAIFSKYPIINKGLLFEGNRINNVLFADIDLGQDTLRIYSLHLESMGINPEKLQNGEGIANEYEDVRYRVARGSQARANQLTKLLEHVNDSPYPVLMAGDFNDVPFSYNYFKVRQKLTNAFEKGGNGFGFTYNGKIPFLRIDHQFFGEGIEIVQFSTLNQVNYSDHFPLVGEYRLVDNLK
jgi:endonuclease/exonuclease/phosphatase family metal-dependent hydrolase